MKFLCLALLVSLVSGCVDIEAQQRQADIARVSLKYLSEQMDQHRGDCEKAKSSDDDACLLYRGDLYISDNCRTSYGQFPGIDVTCEHSIWHGVHIVSECKGGNQPSCVEIQHLIATAEQQRQARQDALQRSFVAAEWAQAQAQASQAAAIREQTRQLQLRSPTITNCTPTGLGGVNCTQY